MQAEASRNPVTRTLARTHGGIVQESLDERAREMLHPLDHLRIDVAQIAEHAFDLALTDGLGLSAQLREERLDLELAIPACKRLGLLLDDVLDLRHLAQS